MQASVKVRPTWKEMTETEPRLWRLYRQARRGGDWPEWSGVKRGIQQLVGHGAEHPDLRTARHYDVAYRTLLRVWERAGGGA